MIRHMKRAAKFSRQPSIRFLSLTKLIFFVALCVLRVCALKRSLLEVDSHAHAHTQYIIYHLTSIIH